MKNRLLLIKAGTNYFRFCGEGRFETCELNKASVYPLGEINVIRKQITELEKAGINNAEIRLLTITEESYEDNQ